MAKIVTYKEQIVALKQVGEDIKNLIKMRPLLDADIEGGRVSITVADREGRKLKSGYSLDKAGIRELLVGYYMETSRRVYTLSKEHHIVIDEREKAVLDYVDNLGKRQNKI